MDRTNDILKNATDEQLAHAVEANGIDCCLAWTAWSGMERHEEEHFTWTMTDVPFPFFNNVFWPNIPPDLVDEEVTRIVTTARERQVPMFWWTGPATQPSDLGDHLLDKGFVHGFAAPAMAVELANMVEPLTPPAEFSAAEVNDERSLRDWCDVMAPVYEFPEFAREPWYEMLLAVGLGTDRPLRHFVGYCDGEPVASASLYLGRGVAGVSSVATREDVRGQGIGTAITMATLREAEKLGYQYGTLFASPMGQPIYERLGFVTHGYGNCYIWSEDFESEND